MKAKKQIKQTNIRIPLNGIGKVQRNITIKKNDEYELIAEIWHVKKRPNGKYKCLEITYHMRKEYIEPKWVK